MKIPKIIGDQPVVADSATGLPTPGSHPTRRKLEDVLPEGVAEVVKKVRPPKDESGRHKGKR